MADIYSSATAIPVKSLNDILNRRRLYELLRTQLENERASFIQAWRDLGDFILPRRTRFFTSDSNRGDRRNLRIIDPTASLAARTLRSGMLSGITSPARPWFHLITGDESLDKIQGVKDWCYEVSDRMARMFLKSNLYNALPILYGDMGTFATGAMLVEEDFEKGLRFYVFPLGSYCIANNEKLKVKIFHRAYRMTVRNIVNEFCERKPNGDIDFSNVSIAVSTLYENGNTEAWVDVVHYIIPNKDFDPRKLHSKFKKYLSVYYERGTSSTSSTNYISPADEGKFLREKGYDYFPVLAGRWEVTGEDVYGTECPGMICIGDVRQLQLGEKRGMQAIEKMVNPPMIAPPGLKNVRTSILAGDITYVDEREGAKGFRPAHEVKFSIQELEQKQAQVRDRIKRAYFEDLFLMLEEDDRKQPATATEIAERKEEKLVALGPVLSQFNQDVLDPLIEIAFTVMLRQGRIPPPPQELHGRQLAIEYISILAQAMKAAGVEGIERFASFVGQLAQTTQDPTVLDKVNKDKLIDVYGDRTSIPPGIVNSDEQTAAIRDQRAQAQQKQQQMEQIQQAAGAAKDLSAAKTDQPSALTALIDQSKAGQVVPQ